MLNDNLEQQLMLLYDYWFTQFDFPDNDGNPYQTSGGKMVWNDTLKRNIPEHWKVQSVISNCLSSIIKRPECGIDMVKHLIDGDYNKNVLENAEIAIKYEGYIARYLNEIRDIEKYEKMRIPEDFDYSTLKSVKIDAINKLKQYKPYNIAQALRVPEIDMSVVQVLILTLTKK